MLCTCDAAGQGDTCKHMLKALTLRNPHLKKMQIIMALGSNKGRQPSGVRYLLGGCSVAQVIHVMTCSCRDQSYPAPPPPPNSDFLG